MRCDLRMRDNPRTVRSIPLGVAVPAISPGNYVVEQIFARWWMARYRRSRVNGGPGAVSRSVVEAA